MAEVKQTDRQQAEPKMTEYILNIYLNIHFFEKKIVVSLTGGLHIH